MTLSLSAPTRAKLPTLAITASLVLGLLAALALIGFTEMGYRRSANAVEHVALNERARLALHGLLQLMLDAETGERGYLLTRETRYLGPYRQATQQVRTQLDEARALFAQTQPHPQPLAAGFEPLAQLIDAKLAEMEKVMRLQGSGVQDDWKLAFDADADDRLMQGIRSQINALIAQNSAQIEERRGDIMRSLRTARIGIALTTLIALLAFFQTLRQARALAASNQRRKEELERERDLLDRLVKKRTARLAELATHLQNVREDERAHLARELHDELGSLLTAAKLDVARLKSKLPPDAPDLQKRLQHLTEALNSGIALKRRIIESLRPSSLQNLGLCASLTILAREFSDQSEIPVDLDIADVALDEAAQLTVYRLIQESLTNIGKYARAGAIGVHVGEQAERVEVLVEDDGGGFDPLQTRVGAHGLAGMRHRVEAAGGELSVESAPGAGTKVRAWLPKVVAAAP